jgi:glutamate synthase domain-containing protein 3
VELVPATGDEEMLYALISRHAAATGSPRGKWILENWDQMRQQFIKVYPNDLRAAAPQPAQEDSIRA